MPNHEEHCQDSLRRYRKTFSELHRWMDEPSTILGPSHRKYRHDPNTTPKIAKQLFGPLADQACLDHIRLDELESRKSGIGKTRRTENQHPLFHAFWALVSFIFGLWFISLPYRGWLNLAVSIFFFFVSFLSFLLFLGSVPQTNTQRTAYEYTFDIEPPIYKLTYTRKTCPNCGMAFDAKLKNCPNCGMGTTKPSHES